MGFHLHPVHKQVLNYVSNNPGCCKLDVAKRITRHPLRDPSKQYYAINTCIKHGLLKAELHGAKYKLFCV